jgi:uncharacterized protein with HEPN domain
MQRDPDKWLEDILTHGRDALEFLDGKSQDDYVADKALRAVTSRSTIDASTISLRRPYPRCLL